MKPVVFVGPSCPDFTSIGLGELDIRPPAVRGDLIAAANDGARTIVLIDGEMVYGYAPSPSEILSVLQKGTRVVGSASLGALRAVELQRHGMVGHGWVFDSYHSGRIVGDDEVVSMLMPESFAPLTLPLVRIRYAIERLQGEHAKAASAIVSALRELKAIQYEARTPQRVDAAFARAGVEPMLRLRTLSSEFDIKRIDALSCLRCELLECANG